MTRQNFFLARSKKILPITVLEHPSCLLDATLEKSAL